MVWFPRRRFPAGPAFAVGSGSCGPRAAHDPRYLFKVEPFEGGLALLRVAEERVLEGVVSRRRDTPYCSGEYRDWPKVKTTVLREANRERWRLFEKRDVSHQ